MPIQIYHLTFEKKMCRMPLLHLHLSGTVFIHNSVSSSCMQRLCNHFPNVRTEQHDITVIENQVPSLQHEQFSFFDILGPRQPIGLGDWSGREVRKVWQRQRRGQTSSLYEQWRKGNVERPSEAMTEHQSKL